MHSLTKYIKLLKTPNNGNFPYCNCSYIDDDLRVVIDCSCGFARAELLSKQGIDILIFTHFHLDHTLDTGTLSPEQIWCHEYDAAAIESIDMYQKMYGFNMFNGQDLGKKLVEAFALEPHIVNRKLNDGDILDFGHVKLHVIHTPGHTPGHTSFFEEKSGILFAGDVDLSPIGPWYAHLCSDLDDYLKSIQKCMDLRPRLFVGGHNGIILGDDLGLKFFDYRDKILKKEELILKSLDKPRTIEDLAALHSFPSPKLDSKLYHQYFNKHGVYKHLERLIKQGQVLEEGSLYYRV